MRTIIAGGRDTRLTDADRAWLDTLPITRVLSGSAPGVDTDAIEWAVCRGLVVERYPARWEEHGRAAGPIRNRQMVERAEALAVFPGGRGTQNVPQLARAQGLVIWRAP